MSRDHTYPALEQLKAEADGLDLLLEIAPPWLEGPIQYTFDMDYLEKKREVHEQRGVVRGQFRTGKHRIESTYGTVVNRALKRREDGDQPSLETERLKSDLDDAKLAIDDLWKDLETDYLTVHEKRLLQALEEDVMNAREYARTKHAFDRNKTDIAAEIRAFESRFDLYSDRDRYMISSDENYLTEQSKTVWRLLSKLSRELKLHVLPDDDADWLAREKSRFNAFVDAIPEYNESFVKQERKRYDEVLRSEHGPLNQRQQKAVVRNDRRNLVDASAGTGKTLTLTHRFLYLLQKGVQPSRIVAITYMGDAAEEMKSRIAEESGVSERNLNISTIHSLARSICMEAAEMEASSWDIGEARTVLVNEYVTAIKNRARPDNFDYPEIYEEFAIAFQQFWQLDTKKGYIEDVKPYNQDREKYVREKLDTFVEKARTFELSAADVRANLDETHAVAHAFGRVGAALLEAYERFVNSEPQPTDFDDMIRTAKDIVQSNPEKFGRRYDHVLVDEYQDISQSTLEFVDALVEASDGTHMFCVGDDWQSIMGFTGSNVRYFTEFEERYTDVTYTSLALNYRCPPKIVNAGCEVIAESQAQQNDKHVEAAASPEDFEGVETMQLHFLDGLYKPRVGAYAADRIEEALSAGHGYEDIMVLSRNDEKSDYMYELRQELENRGIPHTRPFKDYLPKEFVDSFDQRVVYHNGDAVFDSEDGDSEDEKPPMVTLQSIHSSKGTEAPVVILLHAVGDDPDGIPIEERTDPLIEPATNITSEHVPEERRLFYVALTRAEEQFQAIADPKSVSRFVEDIEEYFTVTLSKPEICGECTLFKPPQNGNQPFKAKLDCDGFEADLLAWPNNNPPRLVEGETYRIVDPVVDKSEYGEEIRFDRSTVEQIT